MKRLKSFEAMYSNPAIESELGNISREGDITPAELKSLCDGILSLDNIDAMTKELVKVRFKYDVLTDPSLKVIWNVVIKQWHDKFATLGKPSKELERKW